MPDLTPRSAFIGLPGRSGRVEGEPGVTVRPRDDLALARMIARKGRAGDLAAAIWSRYGLDLPSTPKRVEQGGLAVIWSGPGQWLVVAEPDALPLPLAGPSQNTTVRQAHPLYPPPPLAGGGKGEGFGAAGTISSVTDGSAEIPATPHRLPSETPPPPTPSREGRGSVESTRRLGWPNSEKVLVAGEVGTATAYESAGLTRELSEAIGTFAAVSDQSDGLAVLRVAGPRARDALIKGVGLDLHPRAFAPGDAAVTVIAHVGAQLWQLDDRPSYEIAAYRSFAGSLWRWLEASAAEFGCAVEPG